MIAKLIAHAPTRGEALDRLADALAETEVGGVTTNLPFLRWLVAHPVVRAGRATTAFLTEHPPLVADDACARAGLGRAVAAQPPCAAARPAARRHRGRPRPHRERRPRSPPPCPAR